MDLGLAGRTFVVTGGTSGIGRAVVDLALKEGAFVAFCGRDLARCKAVEAELSSDHADRIRGFACDVTKADQVAAFAAGVADWRGSVDALVNNAGQARVSTFAQTTDEAWRAELDLKFFSQIYPVRAFQPLLEKAEKPAIVAVNSLLAYQPEPHMVCTSAARAGVQNLLKSLSVELAPRIRVNAVLLGLIDSGQWSRRFEERSDRAMTRDQWVAQIAAKKGIPLGRLGESEEVGKAVIFLASAAASYITGAQLEISGGVSRFM